VLRSLSVSRRTWRTSVNLFAVFALAIVSACAEPTRAANGKITVLLTDAPGDIKTAVVTISQIYLQGGETDDASSRVILRDTPATADLLRLRDSIAELVKDATIPAGTYSQLRFVITGGYIEVDNGDGTTSIFASSPTYAGLPAGATVNGSLQMPSYSTSGLKVSVPGGITISDQTVLLVDFDVSQSFGKAAGSQWVMSPVLKATDMGNTGSLTVTLTKDAALTLPSVNGSPVTLGQFKVSLTNTTSSTKQEIALTDANSDGTFEATFPYVVTGSYSLDFVAPTGLTSFTTTPVHPTPLSITAGTSTTHAAVLNAVTQ
jgi:hypothetical protein